MSDKTGIEWTDATWNPIRGCSRVSEGCRNCYAEKVAGRFSGKGLAYEGLTVLVGKQQHWTGAIKFVENHLLDPLKWKKPRRIFVNSMSDLFHPNVQPGDRVRIFAVMAVAHWHNYQVLTKRPQFMLAVLTDPEFQRMVTVEACKLVQAQWQKLPAMVPGLKWDAKDLPAYVVGALNWPLPNVWLGVSVENQKEADERIPLLLATPAAKRFISAEPLLGLIDLEAVPPVNAETLDWVICGGESGPGARPMHPDWARGLRDQCSVAGVPFFFKQWGEWAGDVDSRMPRDSRHVWLSQDGAQHAGYNFSGDVRLWRDGKKRAGHLLDGEEWRQFP